MDNERNARIARAMGWQEVPYEYPVGSDGPRLLFCPPGERLHISTARRLPDFSANTPEGHWCKAKLLEWLANDENRVWYIFAWELIKVLDLKPTDEKDRPFLLATPSQVAEAADRAIQEMEK